jgi:hypothetical protein
MLVPARQTGILMPAHEVQTVGLLRCDSNPAPVVEVVQA